IVASDQHREPVGEEILLNPCFLKFPLRRGLIIADPLRIPYIGTRAPAMDSQPVDEYRRAGPTHQALYIEGQLEIHIVEIRSASPPSAGEIREYIAVVADPQSYPTIVKVFLNLVPPVHERLAKGCARLPGHTVGSRCGN